jgi:hypothetical protein
MERQKPSQSQDDERPVTSWKLACLYFLAIHDLTHIHAIIVLTDGEENSSNESESTVVNELKKHPDIVFFGIAYGHDADRELLVKMANATRGLVVDSSPLGIQKLYQHLTTYV